MKNEIGTRYDPQNIETKWYKFWLEKGYFTPKKDEDGPKFSIVIPPPNITGKIHMGHALNITLQDILVRFKRMNGYNTLWIPGEDHAGIATQTAVEKFLEKKGQKREKLGREKFLEIVWDWANTYRETIKKQIMAIGASVDWSRERFTLDEGLSKAVRKVFVKLYKKGLIYKGKYIVNWCPRCKTVLSDEEVEYHEHDGKLYYIKYPFADGTGEIVIATTRPETMLGDTAVAVHPSDERYKDLIGKEVILPLVGRKIKIIGDVHADPKFGTGALKVTPAHDPNDFLIGQRHNLEVINIFNEDMTINENGGKYQGLDRFKARNVIVEDLEKEGYLVKIENIKHSVGHCYRCDTVIEPLLMDQWFVSMKSLAEKAIKAVEEGEITFYPNRWKKVYLNWMYEIRDWCISRQLWWGHRIPIWYCQDCGHINVSETEIKKCEKCGSTNLKQDEDVLDTWFSSALWPFSTLGWPEQTEDLKTFYPTDVLVTGFDIIFFWVARMIIMGYEFMNEKPFSDVYIHQLVRDKYGRKMSKSLGNGIDPIEIIDKYGSDPMRFTLALMAAQGRDINLDINYIENNKKFANKIWNATRFVILNLDDFKEVPLENLKLSDKWILSRIQKTTKNVTDAIENYEFNIAAKEIYTFFWDELCDWYIEIAKPRLKTNERHLVQSILVYVLDKSLKLLHPFMPFITEELWQKLPVSNESITISEWPKVEEKFINEVSEKHFNLLMNIIRGIRNIKAEVNIPQSKKVNISINKNITDEEKLYIRTLANVEKINISDFKPEKSASAYIDREIEVYVELGELINIDSEIERLSKKIKKLESDADKFRKKLSNEKFLEGAPEEIINETKEKLKNIEEKIDKINVIINSLR